MSIEPGAEEAPNAPLPVDGAIETLVVRLEHEHAWAEELRRDLTLTEKNIGELVASVDAASQLLPIQERSQWRLRAMKCAMKLPGRGRPKDTRQARVLVWLSEHAGRIVTSADVRRAAREHRLRASPQYIHNLLTRWAAAGVVTRLAHGQWHVSEDHPELNSPALSKAAQQVRATIAREKAERFGEMVGHESDLTH